MIVQDFIDELSRRLRDVQKKQWDDSFLISALNASIGALTTTLPQAFTVNRNLNLVTGVEQSVDDDLHRIVSMLHNVSAVDGTPRRAITLADMSVFDASYPHWRQDRPRSYVRHWMKDDYDESKFYVWPPAVQGEHIARGTFTYTPFVVDPSAIVPDQPASTAESNPRIDTVTVTDRVPIKRPHYQALQEFSMYYAYSIDDDLTANSGRAQRHWLAFFQLLNKREDSDLRIIQSTEATE